MAAPIVLFTYARPDHLAQTIHALACAQGATESQLIVFSDGPRGHADFEAVAAVRGLLADTAWHKSFANVHVNESAINKGLAESIVAGVTEVMEEWGRAIVLEDDLLVSADFLLFMNKALAFYEPHQKVGSISGYCPLDRIPADYPYDVMLIQRSCSHGWATWKDRWSKVDFSIEAARPIWENRELRRRLVATGSDKLSRLRRKVEGKSNTWSIMFNLWHTLENRSTIYPVDNRIRNIGFDGSGENCRSFDGGHAKAVASDADFQMAWPLACEPAILRQFKRIYSGSFLHHHYRMLKNRRMPRALREVID